MEIAASSAQRRAYRQGSDDKTEFMRGDHFPTGWYRQYATRLQNARRHPRSACAAEFAVNRRQRAAVSGVEPNHSAHDVNP
jgi:hypothetical protein